MKKLTDKINESKEVVDNNKVLETIDTQRVAQLYELAGSISVKIGEMLATPLTTEEMQFVINKLKTDMDEFMDSYEGEETHNTTTDPHFSGEDTGYGSSHLEQQNVILGPIVENIDQLEVAQMYCIVDLGMNEWNGGYKYLGYNDFNGEKYHQFQNTLDQHDLGEPDMYTQEEMSEMIEKGQIAFEN